MVDQSPAENASHVFTLSKLDFAKDLFKLHSCSSNAPAV